MGINVDSTASTSGLTFGFGSSGYSAVEKVRITPDGNVGIGTANPAANLHISGTLQVGSGSSVGHITATGNISGSATSTGSFGHGYIDGKLGIGTTTPTQHLTVAGNISSSGYHYYNHTTVASGGDTLFNFQRNGASILEITEDNKISGSAASTGSFGRLDAGTNLKFDVVSSAPVDTPAEGTMRVSNTGGRTPVFKIHVYLEGGWRSTTLT